jgi:hypothetical protein
MVHRDAGSHNSLWHTTFNGTSWSRDERFPGHSSGAGPAVVAYRDVNAPAEDRRLFVVHRGYGNRAAGTDTAAMEALIAAEEPAAGTARAT